MPNEALSHPNITPKPKTLKEATKKKEKRKILRSVSLFGVFCVVARFPFTHRTQQKPFKKTHSPHHAHIRPQRHVIKRPLTGRHLACVCELGIAFSDQLIRSDQIRSMIRSRVIRSDQIGAFFGETLGRARARRPSVGHRWCMSCDHLHMCATYLRGRPTSLRQATETNRHELVFFAKIRSKIFAV